MTTTMMTGAEIRTLVESLEMPEGVTVRMSGRCIYVHTDDTRKGAAKPLYRARQRIVNALLAAGVGRKLTGPKVASFTYPEWSGSSVPTGVSLMLRVEVTEDEDRAELLGCGGIFARRAA